MLETNSNKQEYHDLDLSRYVRSYIYQGLISFMKLQTNNEQCKNVTSADLGVCKLVTAAFVLVVVLYVVKDLRL